MSNTIAGYKFGDVKLLEEALTHPSFSSENKGTENYERLEFLGDAVLQICISDILINKYTKEDEGELAKRRASLVCGETLTKVAINLDLGSKLRLGTGEENSGGRGNPANLENAMEALLGAIYLDSGIEAAKNFIQNQYADFIDEMKSPPQDPKTELQELVQAKGLDIPEYVEIERSGPSHNPEFTIEVRVDGYKPTSSKAGNKKIAQRNAAKKMLEKLQ